MNNFNYKESLNNIKASLFDIYENQEELIGTEEDKELRDTRLNKFIEVKNIALMLLEEIDGLYEESIPTMKKLENPEIPDEMEESKILNMVENSNNNVNQEETFNEEVEDNNTDTDNNKKYYLNCNIDDVNFAYVPQELYKKIKEHDSKKLTAEEKDTIEDTNTDTSNKIDNSSIYKQDTEKVRGIIVRSDQYMKLALSKHRQKGVLEEAKEYRKKEVIRRQRENQKRELEKAELNFDI